MGDMWADGDCPRVRAAFGHRLRAGYSYQDGAESEAPSLIFADADYEVGDGKCGLWEDGKNANEPAIVYVRADAYLTASEDAAREAADEIERLRSEIERMKSERPWIVGFNAGFEFAVEKAAEVADDWYHHLGKGKPGAEIRAALAVPGEDIDNG